MGILVRLSNVSAGYEQKIILKNLCLDIQEGDFWGIIGPNGGGKSTLIKTILGLIKPVCGEVNYYAEGQKVSSLSVGYLPQQNLIDRKFPISVEEVIRSGLDGCLHSFHLTLSKEQKEKLHSTLQLMGLWEQRKHSIHQLSGGQLQRTFLGRAVISSPKLLVLDEPQSFMDHSFEEKLYRILTELNRTTTILMVSHDLPAVLEHSKTIVCVNRDVHTHPNKELPIDWISRHFHCEVERLTYGLKRLDELSQSHG